MAVNLFEYPDALKDAGQIQRSIGVIQANMKSIGGELAVVLAIREKLAAMPNAKEELASLDAQLKTVSTSTLADEAVVAGLTVLGLSLLKA